MSNLIRIHEIADPDHRLGRHIWRDGYFFDRVEAQKAATAGVTQKTISWTRHCPAFSQGDLGSCTGNAGTGVRMTDPLYTPGLNLTETDSVILYGEATHFNNDPGVFYPPTDTGSSGPAVAQALEKLGLISGYGHDLTLNDTLNSLVLSPGIAGISWMSSFDTPLPTGQCAIAPGAYVRGGHEVECLGCDIENKKLLFINSWGPWGAQGDGTFWISFQDMEYLFAHGADFTTFSK